MGLVGWVFTVTSSVNTVKVSLEFRAVAGKAGVWFFILGDAVVSSGTSTCE